MPIVNESEVDIIKFISHQEQNLISGLLNLKAELVFMVELDGFYRELMALHQNVGDKKEDFMIGALFLDTHKSYYFAMLNFLRDANSVALMSARKAIESILTAYHLCLHPEDEPIFHDREHPRYREVFGNIKNYVKRKPAEYTACARLIWAHELASKWASHTTVESIRSQMEYKQGQLTVRYTEVADYPKPYLSYYFFLISNFCIGLRIFWKEFFKPKKDNPEYEKRLFRFWEELVVMDKKYMVK